MYRREASDRRPNMDPQHSPRQANYDRPSGSLAYIQSGSDYYSSSGDPSRKRSLLPYAGPRRSSEEYRHSMLPTDAFPQTSDSSDSVSTLHAWSVWRTNINQSLASDLVGNRYNEIPVGPFHQQLLHPDDKGEDVYRYSTAINSGTSLHFAEYINYGIPRVHLRRDPSVEGHDRIRRGSADDDGLNGSRGGGASRQQPEDLSPGARQQRRQTVHPAPDNDSRRMAYR